MKLTCVALDDEPLALEMVRDYCSRVPFLELVDVFSKPAGLLTFLKTNQVDLLFLDIQMSAMTGIQVVKNLKNPPMIIFSTAFDEYALEGYELSAVDYLLKPVSFDRFLQAALKALDKKKIPRDNDYAVEQFAAPGARDYFFLSIDRVLRKINVSDILFFEGYDYYWKIVTSPKPLLAQLNVKKIFELVPAEKFCQVHRSFIVSIEKIDLIQGNNILIKEKRIPIGKSFRKGFMERIDEYGK